MIVPLRESGHYYQVVQGPKCLGDINIKRRPKISRLKKIRSTFALNAIYLSVQLPGGLESSVRQATPDVVTTAVTILLIGVSIFPLREWQWRVDVRAIIAVADKKTWYKLAHALISILSYNCTSTNIAASVHQKHPRGVPTPTVHSHPARKKVLRSNSSAAVGR